MRCVARVSWITHPGTYQSYRLEWKEDDEGNTVILCTSIASHSTVKLSLKRGEVRALARNHAEDGRATVIFEEHASSVTELDIREASSSQLNAFLTHLQSLVVSRPSPGRSKRKLDLNSRAGRMVAAAQGHSPKLSSSSGGFYVQQNGSLQQPRCQTSDSGKPDLCSAPPAKKFFPFSPRAPAPHKVASSSSLGKCCDKPAGFANLGNTCYINAVLQLLLGLRPFAVDLVSSAVARRVHRDSLYRMLYLLAKSKYSGDDCSSQRILLRKIRESICSRASKFAGFNEQDAHELLSQCMDQLRSDMTAVLGSTEKIADVCPVERNFSASVLHTMRCRACGHAVERMEQTYDIMLHLHSKGLGCSLQDLLDSYFAQEEVAFTCPVCPGACCMMRCQLLRLPRVLMLTLKRYGLVTTVCTKRTDSVQIPPHLSLKGMVVPTAAPPISYNDSSASVLGDALTWSHRLHSTLNSGALNALPVAELSEQEQLEIALEQSLDDTLNEDQMRHSSSSQKLTPTEEHEDVLYRLVGVVSHVGSTHSTGHYICDMRIPHEEDWWLRYNDSVVSVTNEESVCQKRKTSGYIFFYMHSDIFQQMLPLDETKLLKSCVNS